GIRDRNVTGVQTCALPISRCRDGSLALELRPPTGLPLEGKPRQFYRPFPGEGSGKRELFGIRIRFLEVGRLGLEGKGVEVRIPVVVILLFGALQPADNGVSQRR